jgi:FkbM family methyltransferase
MNLLRRLASLPGLRVVLLDRRVRAFLAGVLALRFLVAARATTTPWRFLANDLLLARHQQRSYRLRDRRLVTLVHRRDLQAFCEIFRGGEYDPPAEVTPRLRSVRRVVDVGANVGLFAAWASARWPGARITSIEPAPDNASLFRSWLEASRTPYVELVEAAALTHEGLVVHAGGTGAGSSFAEVGEGDPGGPADAGGPGGSGVRAVDVFPLLAGADLVKIDIEGGEWAILGDPRLGDLHDVTIVMEYHRLWAPSLPAYDAARGLLEAAGFTVGGHRPNHWGHGVLWAWKD